MKIPLAGLLLVCLMHGAALGQSAEPYVDGATGFVFPAQIAKFRRAAVTEFPEKRNGVSIRYEGPGRAEAFVYDLGFAGIPTGVDSEPVKRAFAESEAGLERVFSSRPAMEGAKLLESAPVIKMRGREAKLLAAIYTWKRGGQEVGEAMATCVLVTGVKNKILKLLYTAASPEPMSHQADLKAFIVGFLEANPKERDSFLVEESKADSPKH